MRIRRRFIDVPGGQVHCREAGGGGVVPLVLLHPSPGSAKMLEPLLAAVATRRRSIALDTRGNGDSTPLAMADPAIADFARATLEALDGLGIDRFDLFGSHTGASIAMETAIAAPARVRRLILCSMGLWDAARQASHLARNTPDFTPDLDGTQFTRVWHYCRDQYLFWPWYERTAEARRAIGLPPAQELHDFALEVLKASASYHMSYRAVARHPKRERLTLIRVPTLVTSARSDSLIRYLDEMHRLVPGAARAEVDEMESEAGLAQAARLYDEFLDRP